MSIPIRRARVAPPTVVRTCTRSRVRLASLRLASGRLGSVHLASMHLASMVALLCAALLGCASAHAGVAGEVRVLIYDSVSPVTIGSAKTSMLSKSTQRSPHVVSLTRPAEALQVDGGSVGREWTPSGRGPWVVGTRTVRGRIAVRVSEGKIQVLNRVGLEPYVASTVGGEMSASWPGEALRAQAVAARTYVLHEAAKRRSSDWDVRATEASQVYRGIAAETAETRAATRATNGEVLTYQGEPILAVFHSTAGGRTATAGEVWGRDLPYLRVVDVDEEDDAPHTYWRTVFAGGDLAGILRAAGVEVGGLRGIRVTRRTQSGRAKQVEVRGSTQTHGLEGAELRTFVRALGLRSTLFDVRATDDGFAFVGSGHGHGVGMSQWGARALAERGASYQRILARFYPGTRLEKWKTRQHAAPASDAFSGRAGRDEGARNSLLRIRTDLASAKRGRFGRDGFEGRAVIAGEAEWIGESREFNQFQLSSVR